MNIQFLKRTLSSVLPAGILFTGLMGFLVPQAQAASLSFSPTVSTGDPIGVNIFLDDSVNAGKVRATVKVTSGIGDISGVYFDVSNNSVLNKLLFTPVSSIGATGSSSNFISFIDQDGLANNLGDGVNMNGGSGPSSFEVGLKIGSSGGINGGDDYQQIVFDIGSSIGNLSLNDFANQNFGVRVKSVGNNRNGSTKLTGVATPTSVPEPTTILGLGVVAAAMTIARRRKFAN